MAYNQQLSVLGQVAPATTGTAGQVLVSAGSSASSYWAATIPVSAYSAQFNGSNYLSTTAVSLLGDFTIECWTRFTVFSAATYGSVIVSQGAATTISPNVMSLQIETSGVFRFFWSDFNTPVLTGPTMSLNTWYHVAVTKSGSSFTLWINGVSSATGTSSATVTATNLFYVGSSCYAPGLTTRSTTGYISNVRVTNGVAIYTGAFTPPTSPLGTAQAAGTNIAAVSGSQVVILTCNGPGFTDSSSNAYILTNNGNVVATQYAPFSSFSAIARSATQTQTILTSGSGTYYTPSGVAWLRIRMVGGGGGGGGSGSGSPGNGSVGANTTFGTSLLTAGGGGAGVPNNGLPGIGGTASIGSGATGIALSGGGGTNAAYSYYPGGGNGGTSPFGGGGAGGQPNGDAGVVKNGSAGATNSGSGGGGGNWNQGSNAGAGSGGGASGYVEAYISSPAASYAYTVGAGGGGGSAGTSGGAGGGGGSGVIIVEENYAVSVVKKSMSQTILTSGSGTYTTPIGVVQLEIRMVGGGAGGGGSFAAASGSVASSGANTIFGAAQAYGGTGGYNTYYASVGGVGGSGTLGGYSGIVISGGQGGGAGSAVIAYTGGGVGGTSPFGGAGSGSVNGSASAAATNSGSGGGGGGGNSSASTSPGHGGGSGGYVEAYISSPAASYAYTVGAGGGGGSGGVWPGGGGGSGIIIIKEYY